MSQEPAACGEQSHFKTDYRSYTSSGKRKSHLNPLGKGSPFLKFVGFYGHCPNSFRTLPPLSNRKTRKKLPQTIMASPYNPSGSVGKKNRKPSWQAFIAPALTGNAQTRHLVSVSVLLFGSCHLILRRVPQPLWEGVQEKYWPDKVTSGASISQEEANQPFLVHKYSCKIGNMRCPGTLKNKNPRFE